jgi:hypothetical protein
MRSKVTLGVMLLLGMLASAARAEDAGKIDVVGCPAAGIEMNCLVLRGTDGVIYDISAARPRPQAGNRAIRLSGTKAEKVSLCQQGIILDHITWSYAEQTCPSP